MEENVQTGINLSRSTVRTFKHNDMEDLERVLKVRAEWLLMIGFPRGASNQFVRKSPGLWFVLSFCFSPLFSRERRESSRFCRSDSDSV